MKHSDIAIIALWIVITVGSFVQGMEMTANEIPLFNNPPNETKMIILLFPFLFFIFAGFFQRDTIVRQNWPFITKQIDNKYGQGTFENFMSRLKPTLLLMTASLIGGGTGLIATYFGSQQSSEYLMSGFFLSAGIGLLSAYLLSIKVPPRLR